MYNVHSKQFTRTMSVLGQVSPMLANRGRYETTLSDGKIFDHKLGVVTLHITSMLFSAQSAMGVRWESRVAIEVFHQMSAWKGTTKAYRRDLNNTQQRLGDLNYSGCLCVLEFSGLKSFWRVLLHATIATCILFNCSQITGTFILQKISHVCLPGRYN